MKPNQYAKYVHPKNKDMYPANGTVVIDCCFVIRCNTNANIKAQIKITIKDILENENAKAKKRSTSPNPNTALNVVLSLILAYKYTTNKSKVTNTILIRTDT